MLRVFKESSIDFVGNRRWAFLGSGLFILAGIVSLIVRGGPNYAIDFTGGSLTQIHFEKPIPTDEVRGSLAKIGMQDAIIQRFGTASDFLIQTKGVFGVDSTGPEVVSVTINPNPSAGAAAVTVGATASDENTGGSIVSAVEVSVDSPAAAGKGSAMSAVDVFDSQREEVNYTLPVPWKPGEAHVIFVRAQDSKGSWGKPGSATLYVTARGVITMPPGQIEESGAPSGPSAGAEFGQLTGVGAEIAAKLKADFPDNPPRIDREELVGARVSKGLQLQAMFTVLAGMFVMLIYIAFRFNFRFGVGAVVALFHDVFITFGIFSIFNREISIQIIAALLTLVGYSINDTIVVADRIRENLRTTRKGKFEDIINSAINQTLSRTVITSLCTLLVTIILIFFGGPVLRDFALALTIGIIVGTYSSVFVATPIVVEWERLSPSKKIQMRK